ncbi:MAG TPA: response regulator transcription factor [Ktedonobacterales bacterium]|jgi:two-component system response regulator NreC|nr:response regulator transcription factor [Ktedonobacterales bacterium]
MNTTNPEAAKPGTARTVIRILIADDHPIFRAGLRALLEAQPDMQVVGEAGNGQEAVARARQLQPDVVLLDISMPGMDGLQALRRMQAEGISCRVLVVTMHAENEYLLQVLESGGYGYVLKQGVDTDLFEAIRTVARGEVFLYPAATTLLLSRYRDQKRTLDEHHEAQDRLSEREREVLRLTAEGYSSNEIGEQLSLSAKTVETYRTRVMRKLNLHHRSDLVRYALRTGLLQPNDEV